MEVAEVTDYGNAPEVYVDGVASIDFVGPTVRINYYSLRGDGEKRLVLSLRWNTREWLAIEGLYNAARERAEVQVAQRVMEVRAGRH